MNEVTIMNPGKVNESCFSNGSSRYICGGEKRFFAAHVTCMDPCHINGTKGTPSLSGCLKSLFRGYDGFFRGGDDILPRLRCQNRVLVLDYSI